MMNFQVPGKTFLFGEYSILSGGVAVVLATRPQFKLEVSEKYAASEDVWTEIPFHPNSPAGKLLAQHINAFKKLKLSFYNPYQTGGFGASGAEFVLLAKFLQNQGLLQHFNASEGMEDLRWLFKVRDFFRSFDSSSAPSSGSDVMVQAAGHSLLLAPASNSVKKVIWPFPGRTFSIFSTGLKVKTHEHLASRSTFSTDDLLSSSQELGESYLKGDWILFCEHLKGWRDTLVKKGLALDENSRTIHSLERIPQVFARGCGAMGADVVLAIHPSEVLAQVRETADELGLKFQCGGEDLL